MYLFGILEDNTGLFVLPKLYNMFTAGIIKIYGYPFGYETNISNLSEPLYFILFFIFSIFTDPINVYNLLSFFTIFLILFFSYKLYFLIFQNRFISLLISILSVFNPYLIYQIRSHPQLSQIWLISFFIYFIIKKSILIDLKLKNYIYSGIILSLLFITSNYLGFFSLILFCWLLLVSIANSLFNRKFYFVKKQIIYTFISVGTFLLITTILLSPFLNNTFSNNNSQNFGNDSKNKIQTPLNRPIEDFIIFSSRPWYLILPSVDNPFYGNYSKNVIQVLQDNWGNYLTLNYFKSEHSSNFLGITNIFVSIFGIAYLIKNKKKVNTNIYIIISSILFLLLISLPPLFTINDVKIYNISYLVWLIFPMFRVLSRISIITYLIWLIIVGYGYKYVYEKFKKPFAITFISIIFLLTLSEMYVPFKFTKISETPNSINYITSNLSNPIIVVYPYNKTNYVFFWQRDHKSPLINPKGYYNLESGFDSKFFTENLLTCGGIIKAKELGATHIINYETQETFFKNQPFLKLITFGIDKDYIYNKNKFIKYESAGNNGSYEIYELLPEYKSSVIKEICTNNLNN